jgi:ankyrin repeat protein
MCTKLTDNIVTFNVSGVSIKLTTEKLAQHPESLLTTMVHDKVQPSEGWFVECCPKIFGYVVRFVIHNIQIDPLFVAGKLGTTEDEVRKVIDNFKFKGIYTADPIPAKKQEDENLERAKALYKDIWSLATKGELQKLQLIADAGFDLDIPNPAEDWNSTPLMYAAQNGLFHTVKFLIEHGANVKAKNDHNMEVLHFAVEKGGVGLIKLLIEKGANINPVSKDNDTPLLRALHMRKGLDYTENKALFAELLKHGADINARNANQGTPIHIAVIHYCFDISKDFIIEGAEVNLQNNEGNTPLHFAVGLSLEKVKLLLQRGADPTIKNKAGFTPLFLAAKSGHKDIFEELHNFMYNK